MTDTTHVPNWPDIQAIIHTDGSAELTVMGTSHPITTSNAKDARDEIIRRVVQTAIKLERPVRVATQGPEGRWPLIVHPDGRIDGQAAPDATKGRKPRQQRETPNGATPPGTTVPPAATSQPSDDDTSPLSMAASVRPAPVEPAPPTTASDVSTATPPPPAVEDVQNVAAPQTKSTSFLPKRAARPAQNGWRGVLARTGISIKPSPAEQAYRDDVAAVSQHWHRPRTIVVVNGKGGSCKTPTTIGLAAVFARYGGGGVNAWSNHQMRGTLGWHTVQSPHAGTTKDLLAAAPNLTTSTSQISDLALYVHHQPADRYDTLLADPTKMAHQDREDAQTVRTLHGVLARFYRVIIVDTDNSESNDHWLQMIELADQVVVATSSEAVRSEAGRLLLEELPDRGPHAAALAAKAVVVVSRAHLDEPHATPVAEHFRGLGYEAVTIPYDVGMKQTKLTFDGLNSTTQRAYLAAAATIARKL